MPPRLLASQEGAEDGSSSPETVSLPGSGDRSEPATPTRPSKLSGLAERWRGRAGDTERGGTTVPACGPHSAPGLVRLRVPLGPAGRGFLANFLTQETLIAQDSAPGHRRWMLPQSQCPSRPPGPSPACLSFSAWLCSFQGRDPTAKREVGDSVQSSAGPGAAPAEQDAPSPPLQPLEFGKILRDQISDL